MPGVCPCQGVGSENLGCLRGHLPPCGAREARSCRPQAGGAGDPDHSQIEVSGVTVSVLRTCYQPGSWTPWAWRGGWRWGDPAGLGWGQWGGGRRVVAALGAPLRKKQQESFPLRCSLERAAVRLVKVPD